MHDVFNVFCDWDNYRICLLLGKYESLLQKNQYLQDKLKKNTKMR